MSTKQNQSSGPTLRAASPALPTHGANGPIWGDWSRGLPRFLWQDARRMGLPLLNAQMPPSRIPVLRAQAAIDRLSAYQDNPAPPNFQGVGPRFGRSIALTTVARRVVRCSFSTVRTIERHNSRGLRSEGAAEKQLSRFHLQNPTAVAKHDPQSGELLIGWY